IWSIATKVSFRVRNSLRSSRTTIFAGGTPSPTDSSGVDGECMSVLSGGRSCFRTGVQGCADGPVCRRGSEARQIYAAMPIFGAAASRHPPFIGMPLALASRRTIRPEILHRRVGERHVEHLLDGHCALYLRFLQKKLQVVLEARHMNMAVGIATLRSDSAIYRRILDLGVLGHYGDHIVGLRTRKLAVLKRIVVIAYCAQVGAHACSRSFPLFLDETTRIHHDRP